MRDFFKEIDRGSSTVNDEECYSIDTEIESESEKETKIMTKSTTLSVGVGSFTLFRVKVWFHL